MSYGETSVRVPADRLGAIVGKNGRVRRRVEKLTNTKIDINSEGLVTITSPQKTEDPVLAWKAKDMIRPAATPHASIRKLQSHLAKINSTTPMPTKKPSQSNANNPTTMKSTPLII